YSDRGLTQSQEAVELAQQLAHPYNLSSAFICAAMFHQFRRDVRCTHERTEAAMTLAKEQGFPFWMANGTLLRGWALVQQGQAQEGMAQLTHGLMTYRATGAEIARPYYLAFLAEAHGTLLNPEAELQVVHTAPPL